MNPTIYLAGPISGLDYRGATDWRQQFASLLPSNFRLLSPMRGKEYLAQETSLKDVYQDSPLPMSTSKGIVHRDGWDVTRSDAIVANFLGARKISLGTAWELGVAWSRSKPVISVMEPEGNLHDHSMVRETSGFIVPTLEQAAQILTALFEEIGGTARSSEDLDKLYPFTSTQHQYGTDFTYVPSQFPKQPW